MKTAEEHPTYLKCPKCDEKFEEDEVLAITTYKGVWEEELVFFIPACGIVKSRRYI